jgi:hypothetical protein
MKADMRDTQTAIVAVEEQRRSVEKLMIEVRNAPVDEENAERLVLESLGARERVVKAKEKLAMMKYELELLTIRSEYYDVPRERITIAAAAIEQETRRVAVLQEESTAALRRSESKDSEIKCMCHNKLKLTPSCVDVLIYIYCQ